MEGIECPNCGTILALDNVYDKLYGNDYHTKCCIYGCPQCRKEFLVELHYKYVNYSIEREI